MSNAEKSIGYLPFVHRQKIEWLNVTKKKYSMFSFQVRYCTGAFCFGMVFDVKLRLLFNYMTYTYSKANSHSGVLTPGVTRFLSRWMGHVVEPSNLMSFKSTCFSLDTKYPREDTKLCSSVEHTPWKNPKIHIFPSGSQMRE